MWAAVPTYCPFLNTSPQVHCSSVTRHLWCFAPPTAVLHHTVPTPSIGSPQDSGACHSRRHRYWRRLVPVAFLLRTLSFLFPIYRSWSVPPVSLALKYFSDQCDHWHFKTLCWIKWVTFLSFCFSFSMSQGQFIQQWEKQILFSLLTFKSWTFYYVCISLKKTMQRTFYTTAVEILYIIFKIKFQKWT